MADWFDNITDALGDITSRYTDAYLNDRFGNTDNQDMTGEGYANGGNVPDVDGVPVNQAPPDPSASAPQNVIFGFDLNSVNWGMVGALVGVAGLLYTINRAR